MTGFLGVRSVVIPKMLALEAHQHLQRAGRQGLEGFALWAGVREGEVFRVQHTIIPAQSGLRFESGVCVRIASDELHRLNVWLYEHRVTLIAQLHSHPTAAYHSETDDEFPVATTVGSLSLVIPDFAAQPFSLDRCAVYQLNAAGRWAAVTRDEAGRLITIAE
jgi:Prokaryotic homologs of the JAB domain